MGAILPKDARDALDAFERLRVRVEKLTVDLSEALPDLRDLGADDRRACRAILEAIGPQMDHAIDAAHAAVANRTRGRIDDGALTRAVRAPERVLETALHALWDIARSIG